MEQPCIVWCIWIVIYVGIAGYLTYLAHILLTLVTKEIGDIEENISPKHRNILAAIIGIFWPITIFGMGCGYGGKKWWDINRAKMCVMIINMTERTCDENPCTNEEWIQFFSDNISRIPRRKLLNIIVLGLDDICSLKKEELNRIISSEIADRDLFNNKF